MATPSTTPAAASAVVDEAVRITAQGSKRTTESAQAALQGFRTYLEQANQVNRELFALMSDTADAAFQTAFDAQNAAVAQTQTWFDSSLQLNKAAFTRYAD